MEKRKSRQNKWDQFRIYSYDGCSTCRRALGFLREKGVPHSVHPIVETPPSVDELREVLGIYGGELKKLFNTSGQVYRELGLSQRLKTMSVDDAIELLASHGKLIKRPVAIWRDGEEKKALIGFKETEWLESMGL